MVKTNEKLIFLQMKNKIIHTDSLKTLPSTTAIQWNPLQWWWKPLKATTPSNIGLLKQESDYFTIREAVLEKASTTLTVDRRLDWSMDRNSDDKESTTLTVDTMLDRAMDQNSDDKANTTLAVNKRLDQSMDRNTSTKQKSPERTEIGPVGVVLAARRELVTHCLQGRREISCGWWRHRDNFQH